VAGPASRSRLASRCPENRGQRTEGRPRRSAAPALRHDSRSRRQKTDQETSALCSLSSGI
jgi:hypothetical protein